ncbi:MAG: hypothetical protein JWN48_3463 [Myxococcaceae bacterium]|nr:hypothetical protein [Myxococcaceae bacterium]
MKKLSVLTCILFLACSSGEPKPRGGLDAGADEPTPGNGEQPDDPSDPTQIKTHTECLVDEDKLDLKAALQRALPSVSSDGTVELPLSPKGCIRLLQTVKNGRVSRLTIKRWTGTVEFDAGVPPNYADLKFYEGERVFLEQTFADDGAMEIVFNPDGDEVIDGHFSETYAGDRIARQELTRFNKANGAVVERRTLSAVDAKTVHWKVERMSDGALTTVSDFDAPSLQNQNIACYTPPPAGPSDTIPCTDEQKQAVREKLKAAIDRGLTCFDKYEDGASIEQLRIWLFAKRYADSLEVECFQSNTYVGQMDIGSKGPKLRINPQLFTCESADFVDSTLYHEVLHQVRGPHDAYDNDFEGLAGFGPRANAYTDSIRGCEELCFGTKYKNACSCAACFQTGTCDSRCGSLGGCVVRDPMGTATMSEAVGALCRDPAHTKSTWHSTMMDCQDHCAFGAAQCKSYSVSCDDSCQ